MKQVEKRKQAILTRLQQHERIYVADLSREFDISEVTIRKDLKELEERGASRRIHGGASRLTKAAIEMSLSEMQKINVAEKRLIAMEAYKHISDNDALCWTRLQPTRNSPICFATETKKGLTVITTAIHTAYELAPCRHIEVVQIGGIIRRTLFTTMGPIATTTIRGLHVDKAFIGVNGIDIKTGYTTQNLFECELKRCIIESASQSYVLGIPVNEGHYAGRYLSHFGRGYFDHGQRGRSFVPQRTGADGR
jgi:DeoR/GlpR family transcriptional regulator of sugar metabolism